MLAFGAVAILGIVLLGVSLVFDDLIGHVVDLPFLSGTAIGGFCAAFGFAGLIGTSATGNVNLGIVAGLAAGVLVGGLGAGLTAYLRRDDGTESPSMRTVVGRSGVVTAAIPDGQFGTVAITIGAHANRYSARCEVALPIGTPIEVTAALSPTAVLVRAADPAP